VTRDALLCGSGVAAEVVPQTLVDDALGSTSASFSLVARAMSVGLRLENPA
jgi:hypothetical protein